MSRAYRYAAIIILWITAGMMHYLGVMLFAPGSALYQLVEPAIGPMLDPGWRDQFYEHMVRNIPLLIVAFSFIWAFASEYQAQKITRGR
jgi:hypothetical protein